MYFILYIMDEAGILISGRRLESEEEYRPKIQNSLKPSEADQSQYCIL